VVFNLQLPAAAHCVLQLCSLLLLLLLFVLQPLGLRLSRQLLW
jgi:hypothetical protein